MTDRVHHDKVLRYVVTGILIKMMNITVPRITTDLLNRSIARRVVAVPRTLTVRGVEDTLRSMWSTIRVVSHYCAQYPGTFLSAGVHSTPGSSNAR